MIAKELKLKIKDALDHYNKYRSPEANARLLRIEGNTNKFIVSFTGKFCSTCGVHDYFEDLVYDLLDEAKIKTKITNIKQEIETEGFEVTYMIEEETRSRS